MRGKQTSLYKAFTIKKPYDIIFFRNNKEVKLVNQILSIENNNGKERKSRNNKPIEIKTILKFFSIALIIFGIFTIGTASYSMYIQSKEKEAKIKPTIYVQDISDSELMLKVTHNKALSKVTYKWNNEQEKEIESNGKKSIEQRIEIPTGTNTLSIYAKDIKGQEVKYQKQYSLKGNIEINLEADKNTIKVTANGTETLSYMTYRWDEEDETRVEINNTTIEQNIEIPKGLHTLTVIVVDKNNNTETKQQEVNGVTKPKVEVTTDGAANFIIKASDEQGIKKIEFIINETDKNKIDLDKVRPLEERKEFEYKYPLHDGENKLEIRVYNENDISEVVKVKATKKAAE